SAGTRVITRRVAAAHAALGKALTSGWPGLSVQRGAGSPAVAAGPASCTCANTPAATPVGAPCLVDRKPPAAGSAQTDDTVPRATPRSPASALVEGSAVPGGSCPARIAARNASPSVCAGRRVGVHSRWRSTLAQLSGTRLDHTAVPVPHRLDVITETRSQSGTTSPPVARHPPALASSAERAAVEAGIPKTLIDLLRLRVSQLNGCSYCVDAHSRDARDGGEGERRVVLIAAWQHTDL